MSEETTRRDGVVDTGRLPPPRWSGVFAILASPFADDGWFEIEGLHAQVDFARACGVHGVVFPDVASEFYTLSDEERQRGLAEVIGQVGGEFPVIAGVTGGSGQHAAALAGNAARVGADGAMAMAPPLLRLDNAGLHAYFGTVAAASDLPLIVQSFTPPVGTLLSIAQIEWLVAEVPAILYVKQEAPPTPHNVSALVSLLGERVEGVFGGGAGLHAVEEFRRGACGTMPGIHLAAPVVRLWQALVDGNEQHARQIHRALLPAVNRSLLLGPRFAKSVLVRYGVLGSAATRVPAPPLDGHDEDELELIVEDLRPW